MTPVQAPVQAQAAVPPVTVASPAGMAEEVIAAGVDAQSHVRHAVTRLQNGFEAQFRTGQRYLDFDRAYPGAIAELRAALQAEALAVIRDETPLFNRPAATLLTARLSADDLRVLRDFNRTPLGRRMAEASKAAAIARLAQVTAGDGAFDAADAEAVQGAGLVAAAGGIRETDTADVLRFAATPAASRYVQLRPVIQQAVAESELAVVRRAGPRFAAAIKAVVDRRMTTPKVKIEAPDKKGS